MVREQMTPMMHSKKTVSRTVCNAVLLQIVSTTSPLDAYLYTYGEYE